MELSQTAVRHEYVKQIRALEAAIENATIGEIDQVSLDRAQRRLDEIAAEYQHTNKVGPAIYKLYELQALIHYFNGNDSKALEFINYAIEVRGDSYARAERLKAQLSTSASPTGDGHEKEITKVEGHERFIGLGGWLALFFVGVVIAIIYNAIQLFGYPSTFHEIDSARSAAPDFVAAITPALWFEVFQFIVLIGLGVITLNLLIRHKEAAKKTAIIYLIAATVLGGIDYLWASSIFNQYNLSSDAAIKDELQHVANSVGRSIIATCVWVPYFLVSKRVKATLTK